MSKSSKSCFVCGSSAYQNCSACHVISYCGKDHQRQHWRGGHKAECGIFCERDGCLVAARHIPAGTEIFREDPILITPLLDATCVCSVCHKVLARNEIPVMICTRCNWPLCSEECGSAASHEQECILLENICSESPHAYAKLAALRYLLLDKETKKKLKLLPLRNGNLPPIKVNENIRYTEKDINNAINRIEGNSCEMLKSGFKCQGFYTKTLRVSQNCIPNCKKIFINNSLVLLSTVDINKGSKITCSHARTMTGTLERREQLKNKGIECTCVRCMDLTELNTYAGSIYCINCVEEDEKSGMGRISIPKMVSTDPLTLTAPWKCEFCRRTIPSKSMRFGNITIHEEIERLDRSSPTAIEKFLKKYQNILHPTNAHVIRLKFDLTQIYGSVRGYLFSQLDIKTIDKIVNMCQDLLEIAEKLDPGWSKFRGCLLMSLQGAMVVQTKFMFNNGLLSQNETTDTLNECMIVLQEAIKILNTEPELKEQLNDKLQLLSEDIDED